MDSWLTSQHSIAEAFAQPYLDMVRNFQGLAGTRDEIARFLTSTQFDSLGLFDDWEYETIPGVPGKSAVYAPDKPAEKFLAHLRRLRWIERDTGGRYSITMLGRALLVVEDGVSAPDDDPAVVVLAPEDQRLGYGQVLGRVSECGDALVADHYLGVQELMDLLEHTDASRFLIGPKLARNRVTELKLQVKVAAPTRLGVVRELRSIAFHDRYLIGEQNVFGLTASLNGVSGSSMALLVEMTDIAADAVRTHVEQLWNDAEPLARGLTVEDVTARTAAQPDGAAGHSTAGTAEKAILEVDGRFTHEGCHVRHRQRSAAVNCTNGS